VTFLVNCERLFWKRTVLGRIRLASLLWRKRAQAQHDEEATVCY